MPKEEINAILGGGTEFEGKLTFEGAVRLDGKFSGQIFSSGLLIVGEKALVNGEIQAGIVLIHGEVQGTIRAGSRMEAYAPARIYGDIYCPVLVFGEGVVFEGTSHMLEEAKEGESPAPAGERPGPT